MDAYGGTCLNVGCIPSKAYITAADLAHRAGHAERMGVHADPAVDMKGLKSWKDGVVDGLTGGVESLCRTNGVNLVEGRAAFAGENRVRVAHRGEGQGSESVEFEYAVLATGSRPTEIPGFGYDERVLSSADVFELESVPESLLVVGGGYIGMELSTVFAKLGSEVTVIEALDEVLPGYEEDVATVVRERVETLGVEFRFGEGAADWTDVGGAVQVTTETDEGEEHEYAADRVLVAVGRTPVTDTLELEAVGIGTDGRGFVPTDDRARTELEHVFAVGDVAGEPMLAHKAMAEGRVAAEVAAGEPAALDYQAIPAAVFTDPEVATVGLTREKAAAEGFEPLVGRVPMSASGRALTRDETEGFVRVVADADTEFVLGAQIVGPEASELIAEFALAVEMGARLEDVVSTVHTHPTLAETVMEASARARGEAVHTPNG
jgi:dihydrolipoamide dehydrogenase